MDTTKSAEAVKKYLVKLATKDKLPMDLNDLSIKAIKKAIESATNSYDEAIKKAGELLCDNDELEGDSIEAQVKLIAEQADSHPHMMIDDVDGVIVWEKVVNSFSCNEFLEYIGY